jgi:hypothetical protein
VPGAGAKTELKRIVRQAERAGWRVRSGSKHLLLYPANGNPPVIVPRNKGGGRRTHKNMLANLRKGGLDV